MIVATAGNPLSLNALSGAAKAFATAHETGRRQCVLIGLALEGPPPLALGIAAGPTTTTCGLAVPADFPGAQAAAPLLQLVLRLILASRSTILDLGLRPPPRPPPALILATGFVAGTSTAMWAVYRGIRQLVRGTFPVLVTGETGTGKELIARVIHDSSARARGPFEAVNWAAIPAELLEAELFGIEEGVATGVHARPGKLRLADGGVLLLDEIGDMPPPLQAKLLRVLQSMEVHAIGARAGVRVDVRVISLTNRNLDQLVAEGAFRRDLYHRIAGFTLRVPPLRERREDIPELAEHFLRRLAEEVGKDIRGITLKALHALVEAPWPGNVRELEHELRRAVYACPPGHAIDSALLSASVLCPANQVDPASPDPGNDLDIARHTESIERQLITLALARARGNRSKAARLLGITRNGLALKLQRLGIAS